MRLPNAGLLVAQESGDVATSQLFVVQPEGSGSGSGHEARHLRQHHRSSPNGKLVAFDRTDPVEPEHRSLVLRPRILKSAKRLTFDPAIDSLPIWSPDGSSNDFLPRIAELEFDLYLKDTNGAQEEKMIPQDGPGPISHGLVARWKICGVRARHRTCGIVGLTGSATRQSVSQSQSPR